MTDYEGAEVQTMGILHPEGCPAQFLRGRAVVQFLLRVRPVKREIPSASLKALRYAWAFLR
jgi:hypothetical protein